MKFSLKLNYLLLYFDIPRHFQLPSYTTVPSYTPLQHNQTRKKQNKLLSHETTIKEDMRKRDIACMSKTAEAVIGKTISHFKFLPKLC